MNISFSIKDGKEGIQAASLFSERRAGTLPALSGIALVAGDAGIHIRATNLEVGIDIEIPGTVEKEGVVVVPGAVFRDTILSLPQTGTVALEQSGETLILTSSAGKNVFKTLSADDFPTLPLPEKKHSHTFSGSLIKGLIQAVAPYASPSTIRPELSSILLSVSGGVIKAVASDSFRLAEKKESIEGSVSPFSILIPAKNALEFQKVLPDGEITLSFDDNQCSFVWKNGMITTRLVSASYPDYEQIIPKQSTASATLLKRDFESSLRRAAVFSDSFQKIRVGTDPAHKKVVISARSQDVGESQEELSAVTEGEAVELSFNHRYLMAPLAGIGPDSITLSWTGIGRPLIIRGTGDPSFLYLVMPMNQ